MHESFILSLEKTLFFLKGKVFRILLNRNWWNFILFLGNYYFFQSYLRLLLFFCFLRETAYIFIFLLIFFWGSSILLLVVTIFKFLLIQYTFPHVFLVFNVEFIFFIIFQHVIHLTFNINWLSVKFFRKFPWVKLFS